jgi:hypothetical protein
LVSLVYHCGLERMSSDEQILRSYYQRRTNYEGLR